MVSWINFAIYMLGECKYSSSCRPCARFLIPRCMETKALPNLFQLAAFAVRVLSLHHPRRFIIQHYQIPALHVESTQLFARLSSIVQQFVHHVRLSPGVRRAARAYLTHGSKATKEVIEFSGCDGVGQVANE
jgi:hypothetical protein